jgi:diguanylate cyclase (GGDEF)-like protein/PAS domain S-box-containing protein
MHLPSTFTPLNGRSKLADTSRKNHLAVRKSEEQLSSIEQSSMRQAGAKEDREVFWLAVDGRPIPALLAAQGVTAPSSIDIPERPIAYFVPVAVERLGSAVRELRRTLGEHAYLVIAAEGLSGGWTERAIALGADDVVDPTSGEDIVVCLARTRRALERVRATFEERGHLAIERDYLQACIDNLPAPIFFKNADGIYVGCNVAFATFIGRAPDGVVGRSVFEVAPEALASRYQTADDELLRRGGTQVYESEVRHSDGASRHVVFHKAAMQGGDGRVRGIAGAILDITERKRLEARLIEAAERDPLTNAFNRRKFFELVEQIVQAAASNGQRLAVAVIDVDQFKLINDRLGHAEGDNALRLIAGVLEETIGEGNVIARAGGEEFYALFPDASIDDAARIADRMRFEVERGCRHSALSSVAGTVSIGLAGFDPLAEALDEALKRADDALYLAKNNGRNRICIAA